MKRNKFLLLTIILGILFGSLYYCQTPKLFDTSGFDAIPEDAAFIFSMKNGHEAIASLQATEFWKNLSQNISIAGANHKFSFLDSIMESNESTKIIWHGVDVYFSIHPTKARDFDLLGIFKGPENISNESIASWSKQWAKDRVKYQTREYENIKIHEFSKNDHAIVTLALSKGFLLVSTTSFLVENAIRQLKTGTSIQKSKAFKKIKIENSIEKNIHLYINHFGLQAYLKPYFSEGYSSLLQSIGSFSRWDAFSVELKNMEVDFEGTSASLDTTDLLMCFRNQNKIKSEIQNILPSRTAFYLRFGSDNLLQTLRNMQSNNLFFDQNIVEPPLDKTISNNRSKIKSLMLDWAGNEMALFITEASGTQITNNSFAVIQISDKKLADASLSSLQKIFNNNIITEKYKKSSFGRINSKNIVSNHYGKQFQMLQNPWYTVFDDFVIFSNQLSSLKAIIDDLENKKTLISVMSEKELENLTIPGNISMYINFTKSINLLFAITKPELNTFITQKKDVWNNFGSFQFNIGNSPGKIEFNAQVYLKKDRQKSINLLWSQDLESKVTLAPVLLASGDNKYSVLCQDSNHQVYFFDDSGNLLWVKNFNEQILSQIYQVDYYKNGGKQLFFSTESKLYLINLEGENIARFPIRLPANAENPAVMMDLDGRNNYNVYVACENGQIYSYELSGKPAPDWQLDKALFGIHDGFELIKNKTGRFLLIKSSTGYYLADKRGKTKPLIAGKPPESYIINKILEDTSGRSIICFTDSLKSGTIKEDGAIDKFWPQFPEAISTAFLTLNPDSRVIQSVLYKDSIIFTTSEGKSICKKSIPNMSSFSWSYTNGPESNTHIGLSSPINNQFYLLESNCNIANGFPIQGSGKFSLLNITQKNIVLVAIGSNDKSIYVYHIE